MDMPRLPSIFALLLVFFASGAGSQTLQLPENLVNLDSDKGAELLKESEALEAYWPLSIQFVTQKNQAFCGVASIVMVLNALAVPAPATPEFEPFKTFTQDNVFNLKTDMVITQEVLARQGMTLDQIGLFLSSYPVRAEVHHAADTTLENFRSQAREHLASDGRHVIVNYLRMAIGQEKGGHISPLAAYDADTDRFLILDVSRYKYPPVWVSARELFDAMNTTDSDNENRTRGFVLVTAKQ